MINLITGYNNTGKSDWIYNQIRPKISFYLKQNDSDFTDEREGDWELVNSLFEQLKHYPDKEILTVYYNQPENGLHSSLQSKLVDKFVKLHNEGYDLYIETYSDHIINSIRVAIKQGLIKSNDVKVLFFKAVDDIVKIEIDKRGTTNIEIDGFCDEYEKHLIVLL